MKYLLIGVCVLFSIQIYGQKVVRLTPQPGRIFINQNMEDLEILNDSTLNTSIDEGHIYQIRNDTVVIKYGYQWYGPNNSSGYKVEHHPYKIITANNDTIILKHHYQAILGLVKEHDETFVFVNLKKYKRPVNGFRYLKILHSNALSWKSISVTIDSIGKVTYAKFTIGLDGNRKDTLNITGQFSEMEFEHFKDILSVSLVKSLKLEYGCGLDPAPTDFTLEDESGTFKSKGCIITHLPQQLLFNYLYEVDKNTGIQWGNK